MRSTREGILASIFISITAHLGAILALSGHIWGHLGAILAPCSLSLGQFWPHLGSSWVYLGPSWLTLAPSWRHLGFILAPSWPHLGQFWPHRRQSWEGLPWMGWWGTPKGIEYKIPQNIKKGKNTNLLFLTPLFDYDLT